ncbi:MAG: hypothetical protein EU539_01230 [Promethearchaeota archaeon]|nr:MAG: hypothetical protein EU539_01230 [Candidatus Lokiarchaeota archaeon]
MINGTIVPSLTFFNSDLEINLELNSILIRHILLNGAKAIYLFGTTGEGLYFSNKIEAKTKLIDLTYSIAKNIPIFLGAFGNEVDEIVDQIEIIGKKYGRIKFFLAPPFSKKVTATDLGQHFENILDSISIDSEIYLYHNPEVFYGNEINPPIVKDLLKYPNLKGIKDASDKINNYKTYIEMLNEEFSVFCGNEHNFSFFLQLIPQELRKFSGLIPSIANLLNICAKLYNASLMDNILELHQFQEQLNDVIDKLYDIKLNEGRIQRGLKFAFLHLYKDILKTSVDDLFIVNPDIHRELDNITKTRIKATTNYLLNQKYIYQLYSLTKEELYELNEIIRLFSNIEILTKQGKIRKIIGPFDADTNTIYRVNFENSQLIFRFRTSKSFQYENIIKEKILYPLLDGSLSPFSSKLDDEIENLKNSKTGTYIFDKKKPPIIPVANLIYYDETRRIIPYVFSVLDYIHGKSLHAILQENLNDSFNLDLETPKYINLFVNLGDLLGKLHEIKFYSFYESIEDIQRNKDKTWHDVFNKRLQNQIQEAKNNKLPDIEEIVAFFKENESLIAEEEEPVLLHNDFQSKNIIVKDDVTKIKINGIIDFDNWGIGVRAQDFVKIRYFDLNLLNQSKFDDALYEGYNRHYKIDDDFKKKIDLYSLYWLLELNNQEIKNNKDISKKDKTIQKFLRLIS